MLDHRGPPGDTEHEQQHPGGQVGVGEVERRPCTEVDEVGDTAALDSVDQVREGAAEEQSAGYATGERTMQDRPAQPGDASDHDG